MDIAPHLVMSHGFMEWSVLLKSRFSVVEADRTRYDVFANRLLQFADFLSKDEKTILRLQGWQSFLDD